MNYSTLVNTKLFSGATEDEIKAMLKCLGAYDRIFNKGDVIFRAGETTTRFGLIISGGVNIESDDLWGNKSILSHIGEGQIFGETYACIPGEALLVNAVSTEKTSILFVNLANALKPCNHACTHHSLLIKNLLEISAQKNLALSRRIFHTSSKTIRGRLSSYFSEQITLNESAEFTIPFNRQQLADYLNVDRSAMCSELSKMQNENLLSYSKSSFRIYKNSFEG